MTSHELARQLLALPELPVIVANENGGYVTLSCVNEPTRQVIFASPPDGDGDWCIRLA